MCSDLRAHRGGDVALIEIHEAGSAYQDASRLIALKAALKDEREETFPQTIPISQPLSLRPASASYCETRVTIPRSRHLQVAATTRERRPSTTPSGTHQLRLRSRADSLIRLNNHLFTTARISSETTPLGKSSRSITCGNFFVTNNR